MRGATPLLVVAAACLALACALLAAPGRPTALMGGGNGGHVLTAHERHLFHRFEAAKASKQALAHWPYGGARSPPVVLDPLGDAIHNSPPAERARISQYVLAEMNNGGQSGYSEENPPCYTPDDCHRRAAANGLIKGESGLPTYDNDMPELLGAMQKQDRMILDVKEARDKREEEAEKMAPLKQAPLPKVQCGPMCEGKGAWCCRA
ncbi:hypothetical protein T484DRAFT_1928552 [Baffinella frigidus]|nr:hypothetical protein T484DRAFT_1928552 [Cryptophyta sp. CCMP2293]